jgi:hypothetical protein
MQGRQSAIGRLSALPVIPKQSKHDLGCLVLTDSRPKLSGSSEQLQKTRRVIPIPTNQRPSARSRRPANIRVIMFSRERLFFRVATWRLSKGGLVSNETI